MIIDVLQRIIPALDRRSVAIPGANLRINNEGLEHFAFKLTHPSQDYTKNIRHPEEAKGLLTMTRGSSATKYLKTALVVRAR
jgi:hypothetical protein